LTPSWPKKACLKTDSDYADLYIGYQNGPEQADTVDGVSRRLGYGPGWGGGLASLSEASIHARQLDLDMYATKEKNWCGRRRRVERGRDQTKSRQK